MKFALFLMPLAVLAQSGRVITVIPSPNRSETGVLRFQDKESTPHYLRFRSPDTLLADKTWILPNSDAIGPLCSDGAGNLSLASCTHPSVYVMRDGTTSRVDLLTGGVGAGGIIRTWDSTGTTVLNRIDEEGGNFVSLRIGGTEVISSSRNAVVEDLTVNGTCTNCVSATGIFPIVDTTVLIRDNVDPTKRFRFEATQVTTATTRVLTVQDANYTIAGTNIDNTFTGTQTLFNGTLAASGTSNVGTGAAPFADMFGTTVYAPNVAMHKLGTPATSFKWKFDPYVTATNVLYLTDPGPTDILYISAAVSPRIMRWKGHLTPMDTASFDLGLEWPDMEWRNGFFTGAMQADSYRARTGNGTSVEVVDTNQNITGNAISSNATGFISFGTGAARRADMIPGGATAGGIIRTWNAAGDTVLNTIDETGGVFKKITASGTQGMIVLDPSPASPGYTTVTGTSTTGFDLNAITGGATIRLYGHSGITFRTGTSDPIATFSATGDLNLITGALRFNGTTVVDTSRNATFTSVATGNITFPADNTYSIGDTTNAPQAVNSRSLAIYRGGTTDLRVSILPGSALGSGIISVYDYLGNVVNSLTTTGVRTTIGFVANGNTGLSATFNPTTCSSLTFTFGILTAKAGC